MSDGASGVGGRAATATHPGGGGRLVYIDVLRVLAVAWLVPFHAARVFDEREAFYVENAERSGLLTALIGLSAPWHMPLLFVLAGMSTAFALSRRSNGAYVRERVERLLVPLVFGVLVVVPPQAYLAQVNLPGGEGDYVAFLAGYAQVDPSDLSGYRGTFSPGHLWFILYLLVLSLAALPLIRWLRSEGGTRALDRASRRVTAPVLALGPAIVLALATLLPAPGGKNPFLYFVLFVLGYVLVAAPRLLDTVDRRLGIFGALGVGLLLALNAFTRGLLPLPDPAVGRPAVLLLVSTATWILVLALLVTARRFVTAAPGWLGWAGEVAYPFYIWHQTVVIAVAFVVVAWPIGALPKFAAIVGGSFVLTAILTEATRRWSLGRFLFGMKPRRPAARPVVAQLPEAPATTG